MSVRVTRYEIRDARGRLVAVHERHDDADGATKEFAWVRDGRKGLDGLPLGQLPLYGSEDVESWPPAAPIVIVEGEKAREALKAEGFRALATVTGASACPDPEPLDVLRGRHVILWPDADDPGHVHMEKVAGRLRPIAASVRIFEWVDAPPKGDAADYLANGDNAESLLRELESAPLSVDPLVDRFVDADMGWNDLLRLELPPVRALLASSVGELLLPAASFAIFHGDGGVGKTHTMLGAARAWSCGSPWLGLTTPAGGVSVGYMSLELPIEELQKRAARHGDCSRVWLLSRPRLRGAVNLNGPDRVALRRWIQARGLEVVIIDALQRVHDGDETREDIAPLLEWLHELAAETSCTIILLHHDKKPDANGKKVADDAHTARGTTVIETTPGVRVHMYRHAECRVLKWRKNWFGPEPVIHTRLDASGVPVGCEAPESAAKARGAKTRDLVAQAMRDGLTDADEIAKRVGKSRSTVFEHMKAVRQSEQSEMPMPDCATPL